MADRAEHYREAERLVAMSEDQHHEHSTYDRQRWVALAQVHATLACAPAKVADQAGQGWLQHAAVSRVILTSAWQQISNCGIEVRQAEGSAIEVRRVP